MNPRIKKWVLRPFLILIAVIVSIGALGFLLLSTQHERLVNIAVQKMNDQFRGELVVDESSISLFRNFPYVSIALHDARFYTDKKKTGSPIYQVERLYVGFSVPDLLQKKYNVRRLILKNGYLHMVREKQGKVDLLEATTLQADTVSTAPSDTTAMGEVNLDKIVLRDIHVSFLDKTSGFNYSGRIDMLTSSFRMDSIRLFVALSTEMKLDVTSEKDTTLFRHKKFLLDVAADYHKNTKRIDISTCKFFVEEAGFTVEGSADLGDETAVDLRVKGDKQDFNLISAFLPHDIKEKMAPFRYDGRIYFDSRLKGKVSENQLPLIEVNFGCEDSWVQNTAAGKKVDELTFKGFYTNGAEHSLRTSEVHITNINARPDKGIFKGNFVLRDFTKPRTLVQIRSELELRFLGEFFGIQDLKQITGKIKLDMDFRELTDITLPEESLNKLKEGIQSKLTVENLSFRIPGYPHAIRDMNLHAEMKDGRITVDSASLRIGKSDLRVDGSLSDIRAFLRDHEKPITLALNAKSNQMLLSELLSYDTALARKLKEEISGFKMGLTLETSVRELLNPEPLPKGKLELKNLNASFKMYPHKVKDMSATVMINDTTLRLRNLTGMIDSSDFNFSGRVNNYPLWFRDIKKGRTQIAFDFKSSRFAFKDVLGREIRKHLPRGYRREQLNNAWLRMKIDLKYDTNFRFAKAKIANVTGELVKHQLKLTGISGHVKYGRRVLILDTLRGSIGRSDFDISMKYFNGPDRNMQKRTNSLKFTSKFLDADEMSHYDLAPKKGRSKKSAADSVTVVAAVDSSRHAEAFNIFMIPFSDFTAEIEIGKLKYNRLWLKDVTARLRMQEDQHIYLDTLRMRVADGRVAMRGHFNGKDPNKIYFRSRINVDQVDLEKMMLKLDHLGQDVVINKNIKGRLSGQIKSYIQVHPNLVPIMGNTRAQLNISIYNGTLVDFAPMQAMASYFKDKNLRLIRFDTLQNTLSFSNGVLDIPSMDINSSLGFIQMSGKQSLDLHMEYYLRVPMKMVTKVGMSSLFNKKHEEVDLTQVDEIEYIDKDKKIAFMNLKVVGKPEDFKVALGRDKSKKTQ
jgi:hypothetical protein